MSRKTFVDIALKYVGVHEATGHNDGAQIEEFQRAVDGKTQGESWCMAFVQHCLKQVNEPTDLYKSEHCMTVWNKSPHELRVDKPYAGCIVIWNKTGSQSGHTGIVQTIVEPDHMITIEGNTSDGTGINADGDGVYIRKRSLTGTDAFKVVGFLDPFA